MAEHLADTWNLLKNDPRLRFYLYSSFRKAYKPNAREYICKILPLRRISKVGLSFKKWDLMITPNHSYEKKLDRRACPILRTRHGIASGKIISTGQASTFGHKVLDKNGGCRYTRMFVISEYNRNLAVNIKPVLENVIAVVGDLRSDKMLAMADNRDEIRRQFGFEPDDKVVFVLSTWTPDCLFQAMGDAFLTEARKLLNQFSFILSAHPHLYRPQPDGQRTWGSYLRTQRKYGFLVREPEEDWISYMVSCDVIVTDHTSLAVHGALLNKPFVYSAIPDNVLTEGFLPWRIREISPVIKKDASDLRDRLLEALSHYPHEKLREIAKDANSYPGKAALRIREEIYKLLNLPQKIKP